MQLLGVFRAHKAHRGCILEQDVTDAALRLELRHNVTLLFLVLPCLGAREAASNLQNKGLGKPPLEAKTSGVSADAPPRSKEVHTELGICDVKTSFNCKDTVTERGLQQPRLFSLEYFKNRGFEVGIYSCE